MNIPKNNNMIDAPILNLSVDLNKNCIPCNVYNKNLNIRMYVDAKALEKDRIYLNRLYRSGAENLPQDSFLSVKEIQAHPVSGKIIHIDLYVIQPESSEFRIKIPIMYTGMSSSVDIKRGSYPSSCIRCIEVKTTYEHLVPYIRFDVSQIKSGSSVRSSSIIEPSGISIIRKDLNALTLSTLKAA